LHYAFYSSVVRVSHYKFCQDYVVNSILFIYYNMRTLIRQSKGDYMKNIELFNRANKDNDLKLKEKLRNDFILWCTANVRNGLNPKSITDWHNEDVKWVQ